MADSHASFRNVICTKQTKSAILCEHEDWDEPIWFPQSQIHDESEVFAEGTEGTLIVSTWIAQKKGLV